LGKRIHDQDDTEVSWFEQTPLLSLELIRARSATPESAIIDIGGGAARPLDVLLDEGFSAVSVLDISATAMATAKTRLGACSASNLNCRRRDALAAAATLRRLAWSGGISLPDRTGRPCGLYGRPKKAPAPGEHAIIGTFATDGPERCSGLPVVRYDVASLGATLGEGFVLQQTRQHEHRAPGGAIQRFQFSVFQR